MNYEALKYTHFYASKPGILSWNLWYQLLVVLTVNLTVDFVFENFMCKKWKDLRRFTYCTKQNKTKQKTSEKRHPSPISAGKYDHEQQRTRGLFSGFFGTITKYNLSLLVDKITPTSSSPPSGCTSSPFHVLSRRG